MTQVGPLLMYNAQDTRSKEDVSQCFSCEKPDYDKMQNVTTKSHHLSHFHEYVVECGNNPQPFSTLHVYEGETVEFLFVTTNLTYLCRPMRKRIKLSRLWKWQIFSLSLSIVFSFTILFTLAFTNDTHKNYHRIHINNHIKLKSCGCVWFKQLYSYHTLEQHIGNQRWISAHHHEQTSYYQACQGFLSGSE